MRELSNSFFYCYLTLCPRKTGERKKMFEKNVSTSTDVVYRAPANFSASDLRPSITGTASRSVYTLAYRFRISLTSSSASFRVPKAVCPSCQRNSRVRMKGVGCLNSHRTTLVHWLSRRGRSRHERTQLAK